MDGYLGEVRAAITRLGLSERVLLLVISDHEEHLLLRSFFQVHTYREGGYRVPYVK